MLERYEVMSAFYHLHSKLFKVIPHQVAPDTYTTTNYSEKVQDGAIVTTELELIDHLSNHVVSC